MSVKQGVTFERKLLEDRSWFYQIIKSDMKIKIDNITFTILSPDLDTIKELNVKWHKEMEKLVKILDEDKKMAFDSDYHQSIEVLKDKPFEEDKSLFNRSSIAFLLEYEDVKVLMLGDSHPSVIIKSLTDLGYSEEKKLKVDIIKLSHHGSKKNTSLELLNLIDCTNFIISSDGRKHGHPNKESLSKIVCAIDKPITFYFNYNIIDKIFSKEECEQYKITCKLLSSENNFTVEVS